MLLAVVSLALQTTFPGGTANDFTKHVGDATGKNIVVAQSLVENLGPVTYDPADLSQTSRAFNSKAGLRIMAGTDMILHDGMIRPTRIGDVKVKEQPHLWVGLKSASITDGKVTFATKETERLDLFKLSETFSKPLKVHWFFESTALSVQVKDMPETEFLTYIAKAVGGRFTNAPKEFRIDFDPDEVKTRVSKTLTSWRNEWLSRETDEEFSPKRHLDTLKAVVAEIPRASFAKAFEAPDGVGEFQINPSGRLAKLIKESMVLNARAKDEQGGPALQTAVGPLPLNSLLGGDYEIQASLAGIFAFYVAFTGKNEPKIRMTFTYNRLSSQ